MKQIIFFLVISVLALTSSAEVKTYGNGVSDHAQPIRISELNANPNSYVDQRVKVVGLVDDICPMMGCWVVASEPAGLCIREDRSLVTGDDARFIPHLIEP